MSKDVKVNGNLGFFGLLTILFIYLKLTNVIVWSWFWVLSPIILGFALTVILFIFVAIFAVYGNR